MNQRRVWAAGLVVAVGAAVLTAHGVFEVAAAARVPRGVAWIYPVITDGLALVAYASTARLAGTPRQYAWGVVVVAAGLSGLAQASYLASPAALDPSRALPVDAALRFGVGAWPAVAAAVTAHLLYLLAEGDKPAAAGAPTAPVAPHPVPAPVTVVAPAQEQPPVSHVPVAEIPPAADPTLTREEQRAFALGPAAVWGRDEIREGRTAGKKRMIGQFPQLSEHYCGLAADEAKALAARPVRPVVNG